MAAPPPVPSTKIFTLTHGLPYTDIPFRLVNDMIIVPVTVNGKQELNFLVDTGTNTPVILHKRYVKKLNTLSMGRRVRFQGAGNDAMAQGNFVSMSLQIGEALAEYTGTVVLDNNFLDHFKIKGIPIHGVIGTTLFHSFAVEIDYLSQMMRLHEGREFMQEQIYSPIPMQVVLSRPILEIPVKWEDKMHTLRLMVDTGFNHHLLIYDHSSISFNARRHEKIGMGYSGSIRGSSSNIERLHLGERTFFDVHTYFPLYAGYKAKVGEDDGIIGNALLKQFCVVLDYAHHKFYIKEQLEWDISELASSGECTEEMQEVAF